MSGEFTRNITAARAAPAPVQFDFDPVLMTETYFSALATSKAVDGVIPQVAVITEGEALGHGVHIDSESVSMFSALGAAFPDGVRVKIDHGSGFSSIVGTLKNFSVNGIKATADLHMLKSHKEYATIIEMADTMPNAFGLSVAFSGKRIEKDGNQYVRPLELYSIDLVDQPAANPTGLFSAPVDSKPFTKHMIQELQTLWKTLGDKINALTATADSVEMASVKTDLVELGKKITQDIADSAVTITTLTSQLEKAQNEVNAAATKLSNAEAAAQAAVTAFKLELKADATLAEQITALEGATHKVLGKQGIDSDAVPTGANANSEKKTSRSNFLKLSAQDQMNFCKSGGRITD